MKKFKLLLIVILLPISFSMTYLTSEKYGISAYFKKKQALDDLKKENNQIKLQILSYKKKISLLKKEVPDNDLLEEKAFETLGITDKNSFVINLENR